MTIHSELPPDIERGLRTSGADLDGKAKEALLVALYREGRIAQRQLSDALDLNRHETDALLKSYGVTFDLAEDELEAEDALLRGTRPR